MLRGAVTPYDASDAFQMTQFQLVPSAVNCNASVSFVLPTDALSVSATCELKTTVLPTATPVNSISFVGTPAGSQFVSSETTPSDRPTQYAVSTQ